MLLSSPPFGTLAYFKTSLHHQTFVANSASNCNVLVAPFFLLLLHAYSLPTSSFPKLHSLRSCTRIARNASEAGLQKRHEAALPLVPRTHPHGCALPIRWSLLYKRLARKSSFFYSATRSSSTLHAPGSPISPSAIPIRSLPFATTMVYPLPPRLPL